MRMAKNTLSKGFRFKFLLLKFYFDKGFGVTNYFKYPIALFGWVTQDVKWTLIIAATYIVSCFFIGYLWTIKGLSEREMYVQNLYNPFVKTMLKVSSKS